MDPNEILGSVKLADKEELDLTTAKVIRKRTSPLQQSITENQLGAYQSGILDAPPQDSVVALQTQQPPTVSPQPQPSAQPPDAAIPVGSAPTLPATAPTVPSYPPRANDRINKLYGQARQASEYSSALEQKLSEQNARIDALLARETQRSQAPQPYSNQYGQYPNFEAPSNGAPPAGSYVSREEMQTMLTQQAQALAGFMQVQQKHSSSRFEAERDFPDVFGDPTLAQEVDRVLASDGALQRDPYGPYKAAALVRGLAGPSTRSAPASGTVADVQKTALAGMGVSVPDSSSAPLNQAQRYQAAMARARQTQDWQDFARAERIRVGLE